MSVGNMLIFPNFLMIGFGQMLRVLNPLGPEYMEITMHQICPVGESPELRAERLAGALTFQGPGGFATPDDVEALECCGVGFHGYKELEWSDVSRGMGEPQGFAGEFYMRVFWRQWNKLITGEEPVEEYHERPFFMDYKRPSGELIAQE
jgi:p-cumate 2,3-dioxygenase alpha subunit